MTDCIYNMWILCGPYSAAVVIDSSVVGLLHACVYVVTYTDNGILFEGIKIS